MKFAFSSLLFRFVVETGVAADEAEETVSNVGGQYDIAEPVEYAETEPEEFGLRG